jgi:signal transduction histidine kinase
VLRTFEGRLTAVFAGGLFVVLLVFAAVSAFFLAQLSEAVLDAKLRETATALNAIAIDSGPALTLGPGAAAQFARDVTAQLDGALVRSDGSVSITSAVVIPDAVQAMIRPPPLGSSVRSVSSQGDELRVAISPIDVRGRTVGAVVVWGSTAPISDFKRLLAAVIGIGIPLIIGLAVVGAGFIARRGLAPLRDIAALAGDIEAHDLSKRLRPASEDDELGRLSATFDRMLDRLEAAFDRQRRFTADASHELRAPLSVIRAEADLALRGDRGVEDLRTALESIASEADRLETLIGDLLALARAESAPTPETSAVDFAVPVAEAAARLRSLAALHGISIDFRLDGAALAIGHGPSLARVPLALIDNAVKYAADGGRVRVTLSRELPGEVVLTVSDDGPGFSEEGLRRAADRFWRDDKVRGRSGSGLGLAIVRAIVERSGGSLEFRNGPGGGAEVTVRLPAIGEAPAATPLERDTLQHPGEARGI